MKKTNRILKELISIVTLCIIIFNFKISKILNYLILIPLVIIPYILKKLKIKLNNLDITIHYIFIFIVQVLGNICNLYNIIWWYDIFAHFIYGIYTFYIFLILLKNFYINPKEKKFYHLFYGICFTTFAAVLWEIVEFCTDKLLNLNIQYSKETGVTDTMQDMIVALIGSIISVIYYYMNMNKTKKCISSKRQ